MKRKEMVIKRVDELTLGRFCDSLTHQTIDEHYVTLHIMVESDVVGYHFSVEEMKIIDRRTLKFQIYLRSIDNTTDFPKDRDLVATISFRGGTDGTLEIPMETPHTEGN